MIAKMKVTEPGTIVRDDVVKGLQLKVTGTGKKVWQLYYRTRSGQRRKPKLGDFDQMNLPDARKLAKTLLERVSEGQDPKGDWDEKRTELLLDELFDKAYEAHWSKARYQDSGWAKEVRMNYTNHIKRRFGRIKLSEIGPTKVRDWHSSLEATPIAANRALEVLSKLFNFAIEREYLKLGANPCSVVKAHTERKRDLHASKDEIKKISQILDREYQTYPREVTFLYLLMYTGSRPRALERAKRSELKVGDIDGKTYGEIKYDGKTSSDSGEKEIVVLPPQAMALLLSMDPPEDGSLTGCRMPRRLWNKIRKEAGCADLWARDWRRTFATMGLSHGVGNGIIGELQNHKSAQTRQIYQKLLPDVRLSAAATIADSIEKVIQDGRIGEVEGSVSVPSEDPVQEGPPVQ